MSRRLNELERLYQKLQCRLGSDDALTLQLQRELETQRAVEPLCFDPTDWNLSYRQFIKASLQRECEPA
jgi:hypothetical protein